MLARDIVWRALLAALFLIPAPKAAHAGEAASAIRIAHLRIKPDQMAAFAAAVKEEMEAALRLEPGVTAIYAVADKQDPTRLTFFEMYTDENAYQTHRETPHFQKYFHSTQDMIAERALLEAAPFELRDKYNTPAETSGVSAHEARAIRIAHLRIKPDRMAAFAAAVKEGMEAALRLEPGVAAIYAVADKQDPTRMTFFEMYADENAYQMHRETPHFQKYFHSTQDMIAERALLEAVPFELRDKHALRAGKKPVAP